MVKIFPLNPASPPILGAQDIPYWTGFYAQSTWGRKTDVAIMAQLKRRQQQKVWAGQVQQSGAGGRSFKMDAFTAPQKKKEEIDAFLFTLVI